jgi:hypothetical protein
MLSSLNQSHPSKKELSTIGSTLQGWSYLIAEDSSIGTICQTSDTNASESCHLCRKMRETASNKHSNEKDCPRDAKQEQ